MRQGCYVAAVGTVDQAFLIAAAQQSLSTVLSRWRLKRRREIKGRGKCLFGGRRDCRERYRRNMIILNDRLSETDPCILLLVIIIPILTFATPKLLIR